MKGWGIVAAQVALVIAWGLALFSAPGNQAWFVAVWFSPILLVASAFLWIWWRGRRYRAKLLRQEFMEESAPGPSSPAHR